MLEAGVRTNVQQRIRGHAGNAPGHGPFIAITLRVANGTVVDASYKTYQCPGSHACGKALRVLISGKSLQEAAAIRHEDLVKLVGPLPKHRQTSYGLALLALSDAMVQLERN